MKNLPWHESRPTLIVVQNEPVKSKPAPTPPPQRKNHTLEYIVLGIAVLFLVAGTAMASIVSNAKAAPCNSTNGLPDFKCSPGVVDQGITVADICPVYTKDAPSKKFLDETSIAQSKAYGFGEDVYGMEYVIPIQLGGAVGDPRNTYVTKDFSEKPQVNERAHQLVCEGKTTLPEAQARISSNWREYGKDLGVIER